jgi:Fe-S oxidoreductase
MSLNPVFAPLLLAALLFFAWSCYRRFGLLSLGKPENRSDHFSLRIWDMLLYAFGQKRVVARPFGINHFVIFWSFIILLIANAEFLLNGVFPAFSLDFLPTQIHYGLLFAFDLVSILTLICICFSFARRLVFRPAYLDTPYVKGRSFEAFMILSFIALLMVAYFGLNGVRIAMGLMPGAQYMPVSSLVATFFGGCGGGCGSCGLLPWGMFFWWLHALVLLAFICYLPHSKHMHILTAIPNCFFQSLEIPNTQPREEFSRGNSYGVGQVTDFTWKDMLDSFSCTECGRCQDACPAAATGKSLNPRQVIHAIKTNLFANAAQLRNGESPTLPLIGAECEGSSTEETIWACTTCGACLASCPVMIEHLPKIVKMRRYLVQMESRFPEELLNLFENMEQRSNPWGIAPSERTKWQSIMEVQPFVAGETEYLFYVGCSGAFDSRQKQVTVALATILNAAGVSWGTLGKEEKCCGESLRRLGNEYVFDRMATDNVRLFKEKGVTKVIAPCPHCLSTIRNDYRQYGLEVEVIHHSQLIQELLKDGKLKLTRELQELGTIIFHDSCYLGRHNDIYDEPRELLATVSGTAPAEFGKNRENSFCCGGGGGRMWMEEHTGTRINLTRVDEAMEKKPDTICVCCPYCLTMFEDGLKDRASEAVRVRDIAEVVAEGLRPL